MTKGDVAVGAMDELAMDGLENRKQDEEKGSKSYWQDSVDVPEFERLKEDLDADVVIVGGGITGITSAYLLALEGVRVVLLEANKLFNGTTGHTTAKVTAQHGIIYDELIHHMGKEKAQLYYQANMEAIDFVRKTIAKNNIDCDFVEQEAYIFATSDTGAHQLQTEYQAYRNLGIDGDLRDSIPLPIDVKQALVMNKQAQFHPLRYLVHLLHGVVQSGGKVFESTAVIDMENADRPTVITTSGHRVTADKVLACSHFPFYGGTGMYFSRMHANRAYVIAVKPKVRYPGGMYINVETPTRSLRSVHVGDEDLVLVVGENHKAGQGQGHLQHYAALEVFAKEVLGSSDVRYRWSAQDLSTLDKVPYIGELTQSQPNILVATGFRKWGMTTATVAAHLLRDKVLNRSNPYEDLYTPSRFYADPSIKTFIRENFNVAGHLLKGKLDMPFRHAVDLEPGEGDVVVQNGKKVGGYCDTAGNLYVVDTTCTHMGCEVVWNAEDKTWDCPCHGSRFLHDGEVMEGPAKSPLLRLE